MNTKNLLLAILLLFFGTISAQDTKTYVYKGTVEKMPVTLFLIKETTGCGSIFYRGMYRYDKVSNWLQVEISDDEENRLVMVETGITGILSVQKNRDTLSGFWISPNGTRKLNVQLQEVPATNATKDQYQNKFDELNYENNAC